MYTCDRVCGLVLYLFITHVIVFVLRDFCPGFLLVLTECLSGLSTQAQRPLRPKVLAESLCPRALSTTEHASKLSRAHLLCDSSRSYEAMQDSGNGEFGPVRTYHTNERGGNPSASESQGSPGQAGRPLWSGEWLKRAAAASKCLGKTLVAHFDHAL